MPKRPPQTSSNNAVYIVGGIIVLALLAFSFSRILRPKQSATPVAADTALAPPAGDVTNVPTAPTASTESAPVSTLPPLASPRGAVPPPVTSPLGDGELHGPQLAAIPRAKPEQVLQQLEAKQVTIIDVRDIDSYMARHIPGSLHIPLSYIDGEISYLPKDKPIVTYCT